MDQLDFSREQFLPISVPVVGPDKKNYTLREASQEAIIEYQTANINLFETTEEDGRRVTKKVRAERSTEALLVARCLFDEEGKAVPLALVKGWHAKVQHALFGKAEEISDLDDERDLPSLVKARDGLSRRIAKLEEAAKNGQGAAE